MNRARRWAHDETGVRCHATPADGADSRYQLRGARPRFCGTGRASPYLRGRNREAMTKMTEVPRETQAPTVMVNGVHPLRPRRRTAGGHSQLTAQRRVSPAGAPLLRPGAGGAGAILRHVRILRGGVTARLPSPGRQAEDRGAPPDLPEPPACGRVAEEPERPDRHNDGEPPVFHRHHPLLKSGPPPPSRSPRAASVRHAPQCY